jgi:hypothetical protein
MGLVKCIECGKEKSDTVRKCSYCGYKERSKFLDKRIFRLAAIIIGIFFLIMSLFWVMRYKKEQEYNELLGETISKIYANGAIAEENCDAITRIWYNSIFNKRESRYEMHTHSCGYTGKVKCDANEAIKSYLDRSVKLNEINNNHETISEAMQDLKNNPSSKYIEEYAKALELYKNYSKILEQATNPSGNYENYLANYNKYS